MLYVFFSSGPFWKTLARCKFQSSHFLGKLLFIICWFLIFCCFTLNFLRAKAVKRVTISLSFTKLNFVLQKDNVDKKRRVILSIVYKFYYLLHRETLRKLKWPFKERQLVNINFQHQESQYTFIFTERKILKRKSRTASTLIIQIHLSEKQYFLTCVFAHVWFYLSRCTDDHPVSQEITCFAIFSIFRGHHGIISFPFCKFFFDFCLLTKTY